MILVASALLLLGSVDPELQSAGFAIGMFFAGAALGLLASQLGNVNLSSVTEKESSEVGGLQGVFQNLGSSLGTALIGSVLIGALATSFAGGVAASDLPEDVQAQVAEVTQEGVAIVPVATVDELAQEQGLSADDAAELQSIYTQSQIDSLQVALFALMVIAALSLLFSKGIPSERPESARTREAEKT